MPPTKSCARRKLSAPERAQTQRLGRRGGETISSDAAPVSVHEALRSAGRPLDDTTRAQFEPRFGWHFGSVRVHTGAVAAQSAREVAARAYTVGDDIVFGAGQFAPETRQGQALLAHELAHVVQQPNFDSARPQTLRRKIVGDVLNGSVGEFHAQQLTPEELISETALVVNALRSPNIPDDERMLLEGNLKVLEEQSSASGVALPAAAGYRLSQVIVAIATDMKSLTAELLVIGKMKPDGLSAVGGDLGMSPFSPELNWDVEQLQWVAGVLGEAVDLAASGEAGGPQSAEQLRAAGAHVTAALFGFRGVATHMAYLHTGVAFAGEGTSGTIARKVGNVREDPADARAVPQPASILCGKRRGGD